LTVWQAGAIVPGMSTPARNKSAFRRYLDAFNHGDVGALDALVTAGYVNHDPLHPAPVPGPAGLRPIVRELHGQGLRFEEVALIAEGDLVAAHLLVHGAGPAPVRQIQVERFAEGRIAEHWRATGRG
jgi:predicted SnoaL-like aldol condensation-catalyzing enzyme